MKNVFKSWVKICISTFIVITMNYTTSIAAPACPDPFPITQPNGQAFEAKNNGDEHRNWTTTAEDNQVIMQDTDGYWKYAEVSFGELKPSDAKVGIDSAPTESLKGDEWVEQISQYKEDAATPKTYYAQDIAPQMSIAPSPTGGPQKILVLLVSFTDKTIQYSESAWNNEFFGDTGKTVKNFYKENSFNNFYFSPANESYGTANDGIIKVTLNYPHPNPGSSTGDANRRIVRDALIAADPYVNFASFDTNGNGYIESNELHIVTIVAGYERSCGAIAPNVWGHRWSLFGTVPAPILDGKYIGASGHGGYTQQGEIHAIGGDHMAVIGILCHELAHDLGATDLYDTVSGYNVVGASSLMDCGSWGGGYGDYSGSIPTHLDPWHKSFLGFVTPTIVSSGIQTLKSATTGQYNVIKIITSNPDEYFLAENRNPSSFDFGLHYEGITDGGIAIWHIEEGIINTYIFSDTVNNSGHNPGVYLEKAASLSEPYYRQGGLKDTFDDTTTPNSKLYSGANSTVSLKVLDPTATSMRVQIGSVPIAELQFNPATYAVNENAASIALTVTRTGDTSGPLTVDYATSNVTATAGSDYTATSGTLAFAAGETSKTITVPILDDAVYEGNETFKISLSNPSTGIIAVNSATVTITDDENPPAQVGFNPVSYSVAENDGTANITVVRSGDTTSAVSVDYATNDNTALTGSDYTAVSGTLSFASGETSKTINIPILDDTTHESSESFKVSLSNPTGGGVLTNTTATVNITDNDLAPVISFNPTTYSVNESIGNATVTVTRTANTSDTITVDYATANGTALSGSDYTSTSGTITFAPGETSKAIDIPILDDSDPEAAENFKVILSNASGGAQISNNTAAVTINLNDGYVVPVNVKYLEVDPTVIIPDTIPIGNSQPITILAVLEDNSTADVTSLIQWTIGSPGVIDINNGTITSLSPGLTKVTATYLGKSCYFYIAVE
ncbi:Calx-beta domain-containing protein [Clostridium sp. JS66]|uniref:Calx-beta domain-containing protein n=1 Tax=Clostridium sp. JS66 TaxID=3064705 RepID=UPI00298DB226|nr:Calx-beta domain-containing protein [Clostridium sp. JS66]WPC40213.1 Calx-beta domain-containing protein [Clostridium sp. JS66]